jgi:hypothetical protein
MMPDALFAETVEAILDDPEVDVGVVGCVPLTGALNTLAGAPRHTEDIARPGSIANRLIELWRRTDKPWITVVDAGRSYDPLAEALAQAGLPVFRHMDRAMRILECLARHQGEASASRADNPDQG